MGEEEMGWEDQLAHLLDCILVASKVIHEVSYNVRVAVASSSKYTCPARLQRVVNITRF